MAAKKSTGYEIVNRFILSMSFANKISLSRILVIPFFIGALFYYDIHHIYMKWVTVSIFCFAMFTDFIDGFVARLTKEETSLGKALDPLADKLFLLNAFIWIYHLRNKLPLVELPFWLLIIVVSRDLIILLGLLVFFLYKIEISIEPNIMGKLTTLFQMLTVLSVLLNLRIYSPYVWAITGILTCISGVLYVKRGVVIFNGFDNRNRINSC